MDPNGLFHFSGFYVFKSLAVKPILFIVRKFIKVQTVIFNEKNRGENEKI